LALILDDRQVFDIVVLDVMLPGRDGFFVAGALRSAGQFLPILMLTARNRPEDVLKGFEAGADDYLPKPFELAILMARVNGGLRRRRWNETPLDRARGKSYRLTQMECDLLRYLVAHAGQPVSRGALLEDVWGLHEETDTRAIDNFIVRLRKYLEDRPDAPRIVQTVRGVGYKFVPDA